jgi:hypothetical protein
MKVLGLDIGQSFQFENFKKSFKLTWLYVGVAIAVFLLFVLVAGLLPPRSFFYYFIQNLGIFLAFTVVMAAYTGVYRVSTFPEGSTKVTRQSIWHTARKFHYLLGFSLILVGIFILVVLIEIGITSISYIPYAGPAIITVLTIPLFFINFACLLLGICVFAIAPPLVGESQTLTEVFTELKLLLKSKWINLIIYMIISLALLLLSMQIIYYLIRYTAGITKAAQWQLQYAYPDMINRLGMSSMLTDVLTQVLPRAQNVSPANYSLGFVKALKYIIGFGYLAVFSFVASFPLAVYFSISSQYFKNIWNDVKTEKKEANS